MEDLNEELEKTLWLLVSEGKIECGLDEEGQVVYWMTDEQKAAYYAEHGEG